ncbi:MAG TPA: TolC family protein [Terriglobia bacterium]|nr:TolC family protein [Terriglobia bacterium]
MSMVRKACLVLVVAAATVGSGLAQKALTWEEVRAKFEAVNPTLRAGQIGVDEARTEEITAYLRPNPQLGVSADQFGLNSSPFGEVALSSTLSYLHERRNKRELRRQAAQEGTAVAESQLADEERNLIFTLRSAFVLVLQQKALVKLTAEDLAFYDRVLDISRERYKAGDIAQIDLDRLDLQRQQFEADVQVAEVTLRTAKIQLLMLLNDRTPVEQFDVSGAFDFADQLAPLAGFRKTALEARPDLKAALQSIEQAQTNHKLAVANGSTDPTFSVDAAFPGLTNDNQNYTPPISSYVGFNVSIPLRVFDRNQGEKLRTQQDITRNEKLRDATEAQMYSDVDSAYATVDSNLTLLRPYKTRYLPEAVRVREIVTFSYERGGASLLDFLQSEQDYRAVELGYLYLVGSYLNAAAQLNQAVGREVIP